MDDIQPGKIPSCVFSAIFTELLPRYLSFSARAVVALRNNLVVEHRASSRWNEERGGWAEWKGESDGWEGEYGGRVKSTQVEINRKVAVEQFARYFYCRYVLGGSAV